MDHSLNSLNNFDFWRVVLPECTQKVARSIFLPLLVTWMKNIELVLRTLCWYCQQMMQTRELELEH